MNPQATGPLVGITIIDCTMALAGPFGTALLADMGADVIKIEPPSGDGSRGVPPFTEPRTDYGGYFASINRNKRSVVLDLKNPADKDIFLQMCEQADAVVENMRVGVMDRLGLSFERIKQVNSAIVYAAIRGFGDPRTGESPYAHWPAFDIVAQSMSGLVGITGPEGGGGYPSGVSMGDIYPGTLMALGLVSAILQAKQSGKGQFVDVAMYDAMLTLNETLICNYGYQQKQLPERDKHHPNLMPFGLFSTSDGAVAIAAPMPKQWAALCLAMDKPELIDDERCSNTLVRKQHQDFVEQQISSWTQGLTKQQVMQKIGGQVPCGPVNTAEEIFNDPHLESREMISRFVPPGQDSEVAIVGSPIKFSQTPTSFYRVPPELGEHTEEVIKEFNVKQNPDY